MDKNEIVNKTVEFIKEKFYGEGSGHDYFHIYRVYRTALYIAERENGADKYIVSLAALLHDVDDWKFTDTNETNTSNIEKFLRSVDADDDTIERVCAIIKKISFKGGVVDSTQKTIEGKIVQDADRLDAIGAIGIARTFAYGGSKNRMMYDPSIKPKSFKTLDEVKNTKNHTINHFYEKLLKLKDMMNTETGKKLAKERHEFMEEFLKEFYKEWNI
ncbi:HD domain-containing protein [Inconstantimicrobium porci]|uniref:HD domain-containing protein n=1 Tax=Inconstantimicrobium porci TaxID=2652291 RepID=A0A7X2T2J7_9CLOT|nr:HD domain-containing protein [Inconstantimicrobium porci]MSR92325.1 HD domain-containing protein [Inconstantimicrobium porci]